MPLYSRRTDIEERKRREMDGESFWTEEFSPLVRARLFHTLRRIPDKGLLAACEAAAREHIFSELGLLGFEANRDFFSELLACPSRQVPDLLEGFHYGLFAAHATDNHAGRCDRLDRYEKAVNRVLLEERVAFKMIGGRSFPFSSLGLHVEVLEPTLRLLAGYPQFSAAEAAFQEALTEITRGESFNAFTALRRALNDFFLASGCQGNSLDHLVSSADVEHGLLAQHDVALVKVLVASLDWARRERATISETHQVSQASIADAWFFMHIVGALMLRLAEHEHQTPSRPS